MVDKTFVVTRHCLSFGCFHHKQVHSDRIFVQNSRALSRKKSKLISAVCGGESRGHKMYMKTLIQFVSQDEIPFLEVCICDSPLSC